MAHVVDRACGESSLLRPEYSVELSIKYWNTSQRAVMPCGWEYRQGMVHVWVTGKTV